MQSPDAVDELGASQGDADEPAIASPSRVVDLVGLGLALLLCVGLVSATTIAAWSPRMASLLLATPLGVLLVARLVARRDRAAIALTLALAWAAVTGLFQTAPAIRLIGMVGLESSVLIYLGVAACWAIGRSLSARSRDLLPWVVLAGLGLNALVGIAQVLFETRSGPFVLVGNRAHGLTQYSVFFGSLMSAGCVLAAVAQVPQRLRWVQVACVFLFATAGGMSGSRAALIAATVAVAYVAVRHRAATTLASLAAVVAGTVLGAVLVAARLGEATDGSDAGSSLGRLGIGGDGGGGMRWRLDGWLAGWDAFLDRPVAGWGVGNFRQAIQARLEGYSTQRTPRFDAHNLIVEWAVTVGVIGCALFVAFAVLASHRARGPLAIGAATIAASWVLQPAGLSTLPLALLMLGAATPSTDLQHYVGGVRLPKAAAACLVVGVIWSVTFLIGDVRLNRAMETADPASLVSVERWYPFDPNVADFVAQGYVRQWSLNDGDERAIAPALEWSARAVERQPDAPVWLDSLAARQIAFDHIDEARVSLRAALELQPDRPESLLLVRYIAEQEGDQETVTEITDFLCDLDPGYCED